MIFAMRDDGGAGTLVLHDDVVTKFQLITKDGREIYTKSWNEQRLINGQDFQLASQATGCVFVDLRHIFGAGYEGVYVKNAGDLKWKFTIENVDASNPGYIIVVYRTHDVAEARADVIGKRPAIYGV